MFNVSFGDRLFLCNGCCWLWRVGVGRCLFLSGRGAYDQARVQGQGAEVVARPLADHGADPRRGLVRAAEVVRCHSQEGIGADRILFPGRLGCSPADWGVPRQHMHSTCRNQKETETHVHESHVQRLRDSHSDTR